MAMDAEEERIERRRILLGISTLAAAPLKISARFVDQAGVMHSSQTLLLRCEGNGPTERTATSMSVIEKYGTPYFSRAAVVRTLHFAYRLLEMFQFRGTSQTEGSDIGSNL